jgi:hypothetical protein
LGTGPEKTPDKEWRPLQANSLYYKELAIPGRMIKFEIGFSKLGTVYAYL